MSTFFGGEQLIEVKNFSNGSSNNVSNFYTVPSGRYAEVFVKQLRDNGSGPDLEVNYNSGVPEDVNNGEVIKSGTQFTLTLNEGESLSVTGSFPIAYTIFVKEFKKP